MQVFVGFSADAACIESNEVVFLESFSEIGLFAAMLLTKFSRQNCTWYQCAHEFPCLSSRVA